MRYLFIPSCEVIPINRLKGTETEQRLSRALVAWNTGAYDKIVVMGGIYLPPTVQTVPSAMLMRDWLVTHDVPRDKIIVEPHSRDTFENIHFALQIIGSTRGASVTVVSERQHLLRFFVTMSRDYCIVPKLIGVPKAKSTMDTLKEFVFLLIHVFSFRGYDLLSWWSRRQRTPTR